MKVKLHIKHVPADSRPYWVVGNADRFRVRCSELYEAVRFARLARMRWYHGAQIVNHIRSQ